MTGAKKVIALLGVEVALLGAAFGGGTYLESQKRRSVEQKLEEAKKKATEAEKASLKVLAASRGRTQVLEAVLGVIYQNYGMAFDRVIRTKAMAGHMGIADQVEKDVDELTELLTAQKPEAVGKLLALADKLEPTPPLTLPKMVPEARPPSPSGTPAAAPAAPAAPLGKSAAPVQPPPLKAAAIGEAPDTKEYQDGREALRAAKELLIAGGDWHEIVKKLARAQVLLDDSGYTEIDDDLGAAIKAAKTHDEARVRTALEAALARLRAR